MRRIPTLFQREKGEGKAFRAIPRFNPDAEWLLEDDKAIPTEKFDGTACLIRGHVLYKRLHLKASKAPLEGWIHWREAEGLSEPAESGHGWLPVREGPEDHLHRKVRDEALTLSDGTYELVGPGINKNPHGIDEIQLWRHGSIRALIGSVPMDPHMALGYIEEFLQLHPIEGIVWHGTGGMVKIKRRDFGIPWPAKT